jgi:hypothetical protein
MQRRKQIGRTQMRRCGKQYESREAALASDKGRRPGMYVPKDKCQCGAFHVRPKPVTSSPAFPPKVAALIDARDPWCIRCGATKGLQRHHRRIRGHGGDPRPHTDCACVGVRLCGFCHSRVHDSGEGRREAEAEGLIIPRSTVLPGTESVLIHLPGGSGVQKWPTCDGQWADEPPVYPGSTPELKEAAA